MPFPGLNPDQMRLALQELDQALFHHERWHEELNRTLICRLAPDSRDIEDDAHRHCRFGQWLYGAGAKRLAQHPGFNEVEITHARMHQCARDLLNAASSGGEVSLDRYERFVNALKQLRLEILTTKRELEDALFNLDPLSGAANRIGMLTKLREQHALVQRKVQSCVIAMMDFDHFKEINDLYGHAAGDLVIVKVSQHIMRNLRPYDMFFRYGGEEFLICEPNTDLRSGFGIVERLRNDIGAMRFESNGRSFRVTASFGVTLIDPDVSVEMSIERVDKALYAAKAAGRNCVVIWDPSMTGTHFPGPPA